VNAELIQRALISRIEALEAEALEHEREKVAYAMLWDFVFPNRHGDTFDPAAMLAELKRRGLGNGKAGE
jgi:hypothetical protein